MSIDKKRFVDYAQLTAFRHKFIHYTIRRKNPVLTCEGTVIPIQDEMELLSVTLDNKLKFKGQTRKICGKVSQQVAVLNRLKKILPLELRIDIYRAFITPHFNYYSKSWHDCGKRGSGKLEKINGRALRFMTRDKSTHVRDVAQTKPVVST